MNQFSISYLTYPVRKKKKKREMDILEFISVTAEEFAEEYEKTI